MARRGPTIADVALGLIRERGPQELDALTAAAVEAGRTRAKEPGRAVRAALDANPAFARAWNGRWCSLPDQLDGAIFSARLTGIERRDGIVLVRDDLALVERLALRSFPLAAGGTVHLDFLGDFFGLPWPDDELEGRTIREVLGPETADDLVELVAELGLEEPIDEDDLLRDVLQGLSNTRLLDGPPGWLPPLGPRDLLGIRVRKGALETVRLTRREVAGVHVEATGARIAALARLVIGPDASWFGPPAIPLDELLELVATEAPELLHRPLPPLAEVVRAGGLEVEDGLVGHPGTDWDALWMADAIDPADAWGFEPADTRH